jgi:PrcB C-terminal
MMRYLLLYTVLIWSCSSYNKTSKPLLQETSSFQTIAQDFIGGLTNTKFMVINNQKALTEVYDLINKSRYPKLETPKIAFKKETVIALFLGEKNSGGYAIDVDQVLNKKDKISVIYKVISPKQGEMVTNVMTQPFTIIKIPKTKKEIVFKSLE